MSSPTLACQMQTNASPKPLRPVSYLDSGLWVGQGIEEPGD
jgi:hypothetical protein